MHPTNFDCFDDIKIKTHTWRDMPVVKISSFCE